ncbi:winged helix-turn-helix domain-containing protein [Kitasatospora sp. NPDC049285]|uniref:ArsR/SmtB family transcription factor n=1 Tax=Kitasatospora sp. NPDC049285 TaxID=3157096 RepID=UPI00343A3D6E
MAEAVHGSVRIASSWLWETYGSIGVLAGARAGAPWPYTGWGRTVARAIGGSDIEIPGWLTELYRTCAGTLPSFLANVPGSSKEDLEEGLAALRTTPGTRVRGELDRWCPNGIPERLKPLYDEPEARIEEFSRLVPRYWQLALAPYAVPLRAAIEEEILLRSRVLATEGPARLFDALHGRVTWTNEALRIDVGSRRVAMPSAVHVVIVPMVFGRGASLVATGADGEVGFSYQAKGATVLIGDGAPARRTGEPAYGDRLEILLGRSRAGVVRGLVAPTTTSTLAAVLGLATSTVSEHLTSLVAAGLVQRRRAGVRVLYELGGSGMALLEHLDSYQGTVAGRR